MTEASSQGSKGRFESFGRKVDTQFGNIGPRVEEEVRRVITYLNDEVVPQVRRNSSSALRVAAEQLSRLAQQLDEQRAATPPPGDSRNA